MEQSGLPFEKICYKIKFISLLLFNPTHALTYTIKHQLALTFKTLKTC